jgi:YQGE family putative transporter
MPMDHTKHHFPKAYIREQENKALEAESLDRQTILLLIVHGLFAVANALSGTFVNVYLWKVSNDFAVIGWFAVSHQLANALTVWVAGKWVKEHNKMNSLRLGVALSAVFYIIVLFLQKQAVDYVVILGIVQGTAAGFFWLAFNVVYFEVTGPGNRDKFNGWAGLLGSGAGMIAPWISGFLIVRMANSSGYKLIFTISLIIFIMGVAISFFLKKRKVLSNYEWFESFKHLKDKDNPWRLVFPALAAQGFREGLFGFIIGLLVYIATKNELHVGNYSLITSAVALVSFYLAGKYLRPKNRNLSMLIGAFAITLVILPFYWKLDYMTLLIFGVGTALFMPLFTIPMVSSVFDIIGKDEESAQHRVEYVVLRELGLNLGRILGTLLFIIVISQSQDEIIMISLLLFVGSSPILAWFYMRKLLKKYG